MRQQPARACACLTSMHPPMCHCRCPGLLPTWAEDNDQNILRSWSIDAKYYMFQGCVCDPVSQAFYAVGGGGDPVNPA